MRKRCFTTPDDRRRLTQADPMRSLKDARKEKASPFADIQMIYIAVPTIAGARRRDIAGAWRIMIGLR